MTDTDNLESHVLDIFARATNPLSLPEILAAMGWTESRDQECLEILWQLIGRKKVTLTPDRKYRAVNLPSGGYVTNPFGFYRASEKDIQGEALTIDALDKMHKLMEKGILSDKMLVVTVNHPYSKYSLEHIRAEVERSIRMPILFIDDPKKESYPLPSSWDKPPIEGQRIRYIGHSPAEADRSFICTVEEYFPASGMIRVYLDNSFEHSTLPLEVFRPVDAMPDLVIGSTSRPVPDWMAAVAIIQKVLRFLLVKQDRK